MAIAKDLCKKERIHLSELAYIGDDINCFNLLLNAGISACPNNAVDSIKEIPGIIDLSKNGGVGVVREFIEMFF